MSSVHAQPMFTGMQGNNNYMAHNDGAFAQQLKNQIEFYFCPQNLANDHYLLSHLHATEHIGAVPIQVLCHFPKVRQLHALARFGQHVPPEMAPPADPRFLVAALQGSAVVKVSDDGMWVIPHVIPEPQGWFPAAEPEIAKETTATVVTTATEATAPASPSSQTTGSSSVGVPTHPLPLKERNTVILRDIPDSTTEATILEALSTGNAAAKSARPDIGNTWYVTFESEDQAVAALAATRERTIDGVPIRGHLKSELSVNKEVRLPPSMSLPPPVVQDRTPATPLHPQPQAPYYPIHHVITHQSYGYGFVPFGYAVPQQQYGYSMQQRHPHGYVRPQNQPLHTAHRPDSASAPPSSVFVRPNQNNAQNGNSRKRSNKRNKNRNNNKNQQNNQGGRSTPDETRQPDQQQSGGGRVQNGGQNNASQIQPNPNGVKKQNNRGKKNPKKDEVRIDMGVEHFPALGGKSASSQPKEPKQLQSKPRYAEALLKTKTPSSNGESSLPQPTDAELESAMNSLAFTEPGAASYDEW